VTTVIEIAVAAIEIGAVANRLGTRETVAAVSKE
jgi:hypothetical protein